MSVRVKPGFLGVSLILVGILFGFVSPILISSTVSFIEGNLSQDHSLLPQTVVRIGVGIFCIPASFILAGYLFRRSSPRAVLARLQSIIFADELISTKTSRWFQGIVLPLTSALGLALGVVFVIYRYLLELTFLDFLFHEDGLFESTTALLFAVSAVLIGVAAFAESKRVKEEGEFRWFAVFHGVIALATVIVFLEEVSWGQRLFGWETPENLFRYNTQAETNLHNFLTPLFGYVLLAFTTILLASIIISIYLEGKRRSSNCSRLLLPHGSTILLGLLIFFIGALDEELMEILLSMFTVIYGMRLWLISNTWTRLSKPAS